MSMQKTDNEIIKEKLLEFGYPAKGYVIINNTIRYSDGSFVVLSTPPKSYKIGGVQALNLAREYLDNNYNKMLEEHNYHLDVEPGSIEESMKDGNYYWMFKIRFGKKGTKGDFMGYVLVDRQSGYCKIQGLFGG